jgi:hypothetical protein
VMMAQHRDASAVSRVSLGAVLDTITTVPSAARVRVH